MGGARRGEEVAERRRAEPWFPDAFAAFERIWAGGPADADWAAITPFTYGRWDAAAQAHQSKEDTQRNNAAVPFYYADGALDPVTNWKAVAEFGKPVLLLAGEYGVGTPPRDAAGYAGLFEHAELAVQPGAGHFPWLDDPVWFTRTLAAFPGWPRRAAASRPPSPRRCGSPGGDHVVLADVRSS